MTKEFPMTQCRNNRRVEATAVQVEKHLVTVSFGQPFRGDNANRNTGHLLIDEVIGAKVTPFHARTSRVDICAFAAVGQRLWRTLVGLRPAQTALRLGAD